MLVLSWIKLFVEDALLLVMVEDPVIPAAEQHVAMIQIAQKNEVHNLERIFPKCLQPGLMK